MNALCVQVNAVADTNGAGDTFATAYMLALARGLSDPAGHAAWAASRAVMQPQVGSHACMERPARTHAPATARAPLSAACVLQAQ
jgi:sugar/nucleoside kinase (ribokinase family)